MNIRPRFENKIVENSVSKDRELQNKIEKLFPDFKNIECRSVFDDEVSIIVFGVQDDLDPNIGWSMRGLNSQQMYEEDRYSSFREVLKSLSIEFKISDFFAPISMSQNAEIANLSDAYEVQIKVDIENDVVLHRGLNKEGAKIYKREAFVVSPADCLTLVLKGEKGMVVSHAGRNSQHDINNPNRVSVIKNMMNELGGDVSLMQLWAGFGIHPKDFPHSLDGDCAETNKLRNQQIRDRYAHYNHGVDVIHEGGYDLYEIAIASAKKEGIDPKTIEVDRSLNTAETRDEKRDLSFYTNTKSRGRNLVIVIKNN